MDEEKELRSKILSLIKSGKAKTAHEIEAHLKVGLLRIDAELKVLEIERRIFRCGGEGYKLID